MRQKSYITGKHLNSQKYNKDAASRWSFLAHSHYSDRKAVYHFFSARPCSHLPRFLLSGYSLHVCGTFVAWWKDRKDVNKHLWLNACDTSRGLTPISALLVYWQEQRIHCGPRSVSSLAVFTEEGGDPLLPTKMAQRSRHIKKRKKEKSLSVSK